MENQNELGTISQQAPVYDDDEVQFMELLPARKRQKWDMESWTERGMYVPLKLTPEELKQAQENALRINGVVDDEATQKKAAELTKEVR